VLDCDLGPRVITRTLKRRKSLGATVLKEEVEQQQFSIFFRLEGLTFDEMNTKCKQQHSLSAGTLLPASKL
jgi:hypothetical protein